MEKEQQLNEAVQLNEYQVEEQHITQVEATTAERIKRKPFVYSISTDAVHTRSRHREGQGKSFDLLLELGNLGAVGGEASLFELLDGRRSLRELVELERDLDALVDEVDDGLEVLLLQPAGRERGGADSHAAGDERLQVARDRVLVERDAALLQDKVDACAVDARLAQVEEDQVVVGAAADDVVALGDQALGEALAVLADLDGIVLEHLRVRLLQRRADGGNRVLVRSALEPREDSPVDLALVIVHDLCCKESERAVVRQRCVIPLPSLSRHLTPLR